MKYPHVARKVNQVNRHMTDLCYLLLQAVKEQCKSKQNDFQSAHKQQPKYTNFVLLNQAKIKKKQIKQNNLHQKYLHICRIYRKFLKSCRVLQQNAHRGQQIEAKQILTFSSESSPSQIIEQVNQSLNPLSPTQIIEQIPMNSNDFGFEASVFRLNNNQSPNLVIEDNLNDQQNSNINHAKHLAYKQYQKVSKMNNSL